MIFGISRAAVFLPKFSCATLPPHSILSAKYLAQAIPNGEIQTVVKLLIVRRQMGQYPAEGLDEEIAGRFKDFAPAFYTTKIKHCSAEYQYVVQTNAYPGAIYSYAPKLQ